MYLRSVKWHSTLAARQFAAAPETHPFPSTHAAVDMLVSVAAKQLNIPRKTMTLAPGNDVFDLFTSRALKFSL